MVRQGVLIGYKNFHFPTSDLMDELEDEVIGSLMTYYSQSPENLPQLIIPVFSEDKREKFALALNKIIEDKKVEVKKPRGHYKTLSDSTFKHAQESQRVRLSNQESVYVGLNYLRDLLKLKERPRVLECYDVAIWQGSSPTASQIVYVEGRPEKKSYRYYHLESRPEGNNDFAMMQELMRRRIKSGNLPDVMVVDGGVGQVNSIIKILEEAKLSVPVVGIAKARTLTSELKKGHEIERSEERLVIPNRSNPFILKKSPALFRIVVSMRDEAHRFSRKLHHKAERERIVQSWIDQVDGIGPKIRQQLIKKLDRPKEEIAEMELSEIQTYFDISEKLAQRIKTFLKKQTS